MHAALGVAAFVAVERTTAAALSFCDIKLPASVTGLCILGTIAAVPRAGTVLQRLLGPGATWLRATLPVVLAPAFLFPAVCELPEQEALPKLGLLCAGGVVFTCGMTGHTVAALARAAPAAAAIESAPCAATAATAASVLSSPRTAVAALGVGCLVSSALPMLLSEPSDALVRAPGYMGLTLTLYIAAARLLPAGVRKFLPPNVGSAMALLPLLLAAPIMTNNPSSSEVRTYLNGAGAALLWASQPAMVTLGLYAHTHRAVMLRQSVALLVLATLVAPSTLFLLAWSGARMGLEPRHIASVLPASTCVRSPRPDKRPPLRDPARRTPSLRGEPSSDPDPSTAPLSSLIRSGLRG